MSGCIEVECVHDILIPQRFHRMCCHILHILGPGIGSTDDHSIRINGTDRCDDLLAIGVQVIVAAIVPKSIGRLIADLIQHIVVILIHGGIFCEKGLCLGTVFIRIICMDMPVYNSIHSKLCCIIHTILDQAV